MHKFLSIFTVLLLLSLLSVPALAVDTGGETSGETMTAETEVDDKNIIVNVVVPDSASSAAPDATEVVEDVPQDTASPFSTYALDAVEPSAGDTLSNIVTALFGSYTPKTQTVTEHLADGTSVTYQQYVPGVAGLDWHWLTGVMLFSLFLWSLFRLVGGVLKRG